MSAENRVRESTFMLLIIRFSARYGGLLGKSPTQRRGRKRSRRCNRIVYSDSLGENPPNPLYKGE